MRCKIYVSFSPLFHIHRLCIALNRKRELSSVQTYHRSSYTSIIHYILILTTTAIIVSNINIKYTHIHMKNALHVYQRFLKLRLNPPKCHAFLNSKCFSFLGEFMYSFFSLLFFLFFFFHPILIYPWSASVSNVAHCIHTHFFSPLHTLYIFYWWCFAFEK